MPAANGRLIHPMIVTGLENKGVTANSPTTDRNRTSRKIRPARCEKASLKIPSFAAPGHDRANLLTSLYHILSWTSSCQAIKSLHDFI
jgi:hypothetical protein